MLKKNLLLASLTLCLSAYTWADINDEKISFVKRLYAQQQKNAAENCWRVTHYSGEQMEYCKDAAAEQYADTTLARAFVRARDYDTKIPLEAYKSQCVYGKEAAMHGIGTPVDILNVPKTYSVTKDGRVKVSFNAFLGDPQASSRRTIHYTLRQHEGSFRVVDMEVKLVPPKDGKKNLHIPSYLNYLNRCVENIKREFRVE